VAELLDTRVTVRPSEDGLDVAAAYRAHAGHVWAMLSRMGVARADLPDVLQEVFVVLHRKRKGCDRPEALRGLLYAICRRLARAHRRRAWFRRERPVDRLPDVAAGTATPEEHVAAARARADLERLLDALSVDQRAVFVMFEVEGIDCEAIAREVGVPVGTVYSRLHAARARFAGALARLRRRRGER
jgi:RNA polymerase sigma-70 factor (ECF subfamily)